MPDGPDAAPTHRQPMLVVLVAVGGFLGALARYGVGELAPTEPGRWPWGTFVVNVTGAFVLGALLEGLARSGPDAGRRRQARLVLGTGFCGAYTTYSTLAVETELLRRSSAIGSAAAYPLVSAAVGLLAAALGIALAGRWRTARGASA